ncbi:MAG: fatty acid desaturase [Ignavibacteria bacterium]|nr:fatty acid desaturase [Ignavibacteria bacterium]MBT8391206.1 fatty acid desaturase [Ignavibacteria bacterium]NNL19758.1 fatty acid desaturase [Ignavibacteriaceae bacterium]
MFHKNSSIKHSFLDNLIAKYQNSSSGKSIWQLSNSFIPFLLIWVLMYLSLDVSYWLTLLLALPAAGFVVRIFIIQHDCGHGSFFKSKSVNDFWGAVCSIFSLTPYHHWRKKHAIHHASAGKLEKRGIGDIYTMTVDEFLQQSRWGRFKYRLYRNPIILFIVIPIILFVILQRFPFPSSKSLKNLHPSVYVTTIVVLLVTAVMIYLIGWQNFLLVQFPITFIASSTGTWLFYVQHQFEDTYWTNNNSWDYNLAALQGSSYYKLPKILQWFTGNIGFHHIHHLSPKIPNYHLEKCHKEIPEFQKSPVLTLRTSFKSMFLRLWDEKQKKLISFHQFKLLKLER